MVCSANRRINNVYCRNDAVYSFCWCYVDCSEHAIDDVASLLQLEWLLNLRLFMTSLHLHLMKDRNNTKSMQHSVKIMVEPLKPHTLGDRLPQLELSKLCMITENAGRHVNRYLHMQTLYPIVSKLSG